MRLVYLLSAVCLAACQPTVETYTFRNDDRPEYSKVVSPDVVKASGVSDYQVIDVRLEEDYEASPQMIPGAVRKDPEDIERWSASLDPDKPVVVYCVKGGWVSQKAATYLSEKGFDVVSLEGGIQAWEGGAQ